MNVGELFAGLASLQGSQDAGSDGNGIGQSRLVSGVEYALATRSDEAKLRSAWRQRKGGGATPLVLLADDPDEDGMVRVLGPQEGGPVRRIRAEAMLALVRETLALRPLHAVRRVIEEVDRLDTEGVAGLTVRGLGTDHLYRHRIRRSDRWGRLRELADGLQGRDWRELVTRLGYAVEELPRNGYLLRADGRPVAVVHPRRSPSEFARLDAEGRLPEGALLADCEEHGADYGILAAGTRMRLLAAGGAEAGAVARYLDLDSASLEPDALPLLGLLAPAYLAEGGMADLLAEARDYGRELRKRLDRVLRERVLPVLGRELGRWAEGLGRDLSDDRVREELEAAALTFVFRALFLLYAESAGHLPMSNHTYAQRSFTRIAQRADDEAGTADPHSDSLWHDIDGLIRAMRDGQKAWGVPAYNGALFARDGFAGARIIDEASISDAALGPALVALARDDQDPDLGVDFSGLEIGHLGHIYEGLLSLRLSLADRDLAYDARSDRYTPAETDEAEVRAGELVWLTNEGGRKGGGVYYTRTELVRHLVRGAVGPAFDRHLETVRALATSDPAAAADKLFDFFVIDPACGSAHFLVEVVDELADKVAKLLGEIALPAVRTQLDSLRAGAGATFGAGIEDTALLKRLVMKRCVYGVDISPMGAEIAKVSLWLGSFVPGLSLAYLDHNIQVGNSLVGVARADQITPPGSGGQVALFGDSISEAVAAGARSAARLRAVEDRTPTEVAQSQRLDEELHKEVAGVARVFDLWTAEAFDPEGFKGARDEALRRGAEIIADQESLLGEKASDLAGRERYLHWPLAFAEAFARPNPGFDSVVGNPPWEEVRIEELAFYAQYRPGIRALSERPRQAAVRDLIEKRPELPERLHEGQERVRRLLSYLGPRGDYEGSPGDPDTYKFFCQRYRFLLRGGGTLGVVLPRTAFLAKGSAVFRKWLFAQNLPHRIDFLLNSGRWAFDAEPRYTVALLIGRQGAISTDSTFEVAGVADSAAKFATQIGSPGRRISKGSLGPNLEIPLVSSQVAADLLDKLRIGEGIPFGGGRWKCFAVREFHETDDADLWKDATSGRPLWKGESFNQFEPHGREARECPPTETALAVTVRPRPGSESVLASSLPLEARRAAQRRTAISARLAFRDVTNRTNSRTVIACFVPPGHFLVNSAPYLVFLDDNCRAEAACLAVINSLPFDWQARRFVESHLSYFILEDLRLPSLDDATYDALGDAAARLSCPDERFAKLASSCGVAVGALDPHERTRLRVEIDARVARAYGLTASELEVVFEDFNDEAASPEYRELVRRRFAEL